MEYFLVIESRVSEQNNSFLIKQQIFSENGRQNSDFCPRTEFTVQNKTLSKISELFFHYLAHEFL